MSDYRSMTYEEKLTFMRTQFNKRRRARWETGTEPAEQVFSKEELSDYDKDPEFRTVLREIIIREDEVMGKPLEDIFAAILAPLHS